MIDVTKLLPLAETFALFTVAEEIPVIVSPATKPVTEKSLGVIVVVPL